MRKDRLNGGWYGSHEIRKALDKEQEILVNIADIVNEIFAAESAILRTEKAIAATGAEKNEQKLAYTQIFTQEAFLKIEAHAKESLIAMEEGDSLRMSLSALRKLTRFTPINVIAKSAKWQNESLKQRNISYKDGLKGADITPHLSACRQTLAFGVRSAPGAHECQIRSAPLLALPRAAKVFYHAERRQRAKIKIILALCQHLKGADITPHLL